MNVEREGMRDEEMIGWRVRIGDLVICGKLLIHLRMMILCNQVEITLISRAYLICHNDIQQTLPHHTME